MTAPHGRFWHIWRNYLFPLIMISAFLAYSTSRGTDFYTVTIPLVAIGFWILRNKSATNGYALVGSLVLFLILLALGVSYFSQFLNGLR